MNRTQEMCHYLVVQEIAPSTVIASLPIGQAHAEPITASLLDARETTRRMREKSPTLTGRSTLLQNLIQAEGNPLATIVPPRTSVSRKPQLKVMPEGHQPGERFMSTSQTELVNWEKKRRGKKGTRNVGDRSLAIL